MDMNYFGMGRSENLHLAFMAVHEFHGKEGRYPGSDDADLAKVVELAKAINESQKQAGKLSVDSVEEKSFEMWPPSARAPSRRRVHFSEAW